MILGHHQERCPHGIRQVVYCPTCYYYADRDYRALLIKAHVEAQAKRFEDTQPASRIPGLEVRELGPAEGLRDWLDAQAAQERAA